jgi:predicted methyltransferase MtxX (methanogen marker protein 4)
MKERRILLDITNVPDDPFGLLKAVAIKNSKNLQLKKEVKPKLQIKTLSSEQDSPVEPSSSPLVAPGCIKMDEENQVKEKVKMRKIGKKSKRKVGKKKEIKSFRL